MSDNTELIAEARDGNFEDRSWMIDVIDRLADALEATTEQLAAAQAVIAKAKSWNDHDTGEPSYWDLHHVLAQSPIDALAAHDRQVAAKALKEAALALITDETAQAGTTKAAYNAIYATWLVQRAAEYRSTVKGEGN